jgi:hypothetical protein
VENDFAESCEAQETQTAIDRLSSMGPDAKMAGDIKKIYRTFPK